MKKIIKVILIVLFALITTNVVNAKTDLFELEWSKESISKADNIMYLGYASKVAFGDGYVVSKINIESEYTDLIYYNYNGEVIKKVVLDKGVLSIKEYEGSIYAVAISEKGINQDTLSYELLKFNSNLDITAEAQIEFGDAMEYICLPMFIKYVGVDFISTVNNQITVVGLNYNDITLHHFDKNLNNHVIKILDNTEEDIKYGEKYYQIASEFYDFIEIIESNQIPEQVTILSEAKNNLKVYNGADISQCELLPRLKDAIDNNEDIAKIDLPQCYINSKLKLTSDNNVVFDKNYEDYLLLINARIVDNYIVAIGLKNPGNITDQVNKALNEGINSLNFNIQTDIVMLNMAGEIVQTISKPNNHYLEIIPSKNGFAVSKISVNASILDIIKGTASEKVTFDILVESYNLKRTINTKIEGKGSILVPNKIKSGETVEFEVNPEKGYVLGAVKITDANGNVIEAKANSFVMPESDVTIEVTFVTENPETADIAIIGVSFILLVGLALTFINYNKMKSLR